MDIVFPVKKLRYLEIKNGKSTVEYREVKPYWTRRVEQITGCSWTNYDGMEGFDLRSYGFGQKPARGTVRWGYMPKTRHNLPIEITKISIIEDGMRTPLKIDGEVYAFEFRVCGGEIDTRTEDTNN